MFRLLRVVSQQRPWLSVCKLVSSERYLSRDHGCLFSNQSPPQSGYSAEAMAGCFQTSLLLRVVPQQRPWRSVCKLVSSSGRYLSRDNGCLFSNWSPQSGISAETMGVCFQTSLLLKSGISAETIDIYFQTSLLLRVVLQQRP